MSLFDRTFHPDEANQAFTTAKLLETGVYTYRPTDHHGPTLYYAAAPLQQAFGHQSKADLDGTLLRCTPLVFAVLGLVFLYLAIFRLGRVALLRDRQPTPPLSPTPRPSLTAYLYPFVAVAMLATAPMFAFYATDFIQESLLVAFTLMMFWAGTGYMLPGKKFKRGTWALIFGIGAGLAFATKETCTLTFAAMFLAALPFIVIHYRRNGKLPFRINDLVLAFFGFTLTALALYSCWGRDFSGVYNAFIAAPLSYVHRAAGDAASDGAAWHVHPWWQHLQWLVFGNSTAVDAALRWKPNKLFMNTRPFIHLLLLLLPLGIYALRRSVRDRVDRTLSHAFLGVLGYAALLFVFYSVIPYKTPWCTLQLIVPFLVANAIGYANAAHIIEKTTKPQFATPGRLKVVKFVCLVLLPLSTIIEHVPGLVKINREPDSPAIPYNYAHSSPEAQQLAACVADAMKAAQAKGGARSVATANSDAAQPPFIAVALPTTDTWPFPFYNRKLEAQTGYWTSFDDLVALEKTGSKPTVVIVPMTEGHLAQSLFPHLKNTKRFFMRPGVRVRVFW